MTSAGVSGVGVIANHTPSYESRAKPRSKKVEFPDNVVHVGRGDFDGMLQAADGGQLLIGGFLQLRTLAKDELQDRRRSYDGVPTTAQPQTPGRSSLALDRAKMRLQNRTNTRPASMEESYRVLKFVEIGTATAFHRPPEMPTKCVSGLPSSPRWSTCGSWFAVLQFGTVRSASKQSQSQRYREERRGEETQSNSRTALTA
ncbi:MAG: hypothetical protein LQ340_000726 [Diploschistes diacapsis]|nr:MAG: hypothetical protein LQ340_000726 [Diploschistes diacapsis]